MRHWIIWDDGVSVKYGEFDMPASKVMHKWKTGKLHSGSKSGPKVTSQKQAVAIMMSEKRNEKAHGGKYKEGKRK